MNKILYIILLSSMLIFSSCASSDLDTPEGWDGFEGKMYENFFLKGCVSRGDVDEKYSRESQESYCDCIWTKLKQVYITPNDWINADHAERVERFESVNAKEECNFLRVNFDE